MKTSVHAALRLLLLAATALLVAPAAARADRPPTAVRLPAGLALSPDGETLVFSWRGDLWRAPAAGGVARRLTVHPAADTSPHVSPDGRKIAFLSTRTGTDQVHVMPIEGGTPEPLTTHTEGTRPLGWFPQGDGLLVLAQRDHDWRAASRLFRRPLATEERAELLFDAYASAGALSPDGRQVAYTRGRSAWWRKGYRGSSASKIWIHDLEAGGDRKLTQGDHGELWPMWDAQGMGLFFVSEESGAWNLFHVALADGTRTQRTFFEDDGVNHPTISADGSAIAFRRLFDVYRLDTRLGSEPQRVVLHDPGDAPTDPIERKALEKATQVAFSDDAREIAFIAGGDLWVMDTELREPRRITNTPHEERDPVFSRDFKALYFVSDAAGHPDVWKAVRSDSDKYWWQNESFRTERLTDDEAMERSLSLTPDGEHLAFIKERGDLWIMGTEGQQARRLVSSFSEVGYSFSPDGQWVAYARSDDDFNRDVWIQAVDGSGAPVNVSMHPDNDGNPSWSPDGRLLVFTGRRWGEESDLCYVWLRKGDGETDKRDRTLAKALETMAGRAGKAGPKPRTAAAAQKPPPPPKDALVGSWAGRLQGPPPLPEEGLDLTLEIARSDAGLSARVDVVGQFSGSADSVTFDEGTKALHFALTTPLGLLRGAAQVEGERMEGSWSIQGVLEGTFEATRQPAAEPPAAPATSVPQPEAPTKTPAPPPTIDFEDIQERVRRIAIPDSAESDLLWSPDAKRLAFRARVKGVSGLYTVQFPDALTPKLLTTMRGTGGRWLKEGNQIAWLVGGVPATLTASGKARSFGFSVRQEVFLPDLHAAVFEATWRIMRDTYYDERLGNRDWAAVRAKYLPMAAECLEVSELETVVNMMLGELNGSHLGFRAERKNWSRPGWRDVTGHLGVRWDDKHAGEGLRVREVIRGTPAHAEQHRLHPGEILLAVDGRPVGPATDLDRLLTGDPARQVALRVRGTDGEERTLSLQPTTYARVRRQLYDHWIDRLRALTRKGSDGRLGYLHIRSMDQGSFERFEAELYRVGHGKDGLIIDVRDNGGGFTTDHLLTCLMQPRHAITRPRGGGPGYPQDRMIYAAWHKPIVVLCNENSFSNAEIFAHAIKTLKRGPVVGVQTAGGVISTGGMPVMGIGFLRLPFRGWFLAGSGEDMERNGCLPDHVVWPEPGDRARGVDRQLDKAIEVLLQDVEASRRKAPVELKPASTRH